MPVTVSSITLNSVRPLAPPKRFDQFEIANGYVVQHQMVLRFKISQIRDVIGGGALRLLRITQAGARRAHRFVLAFDSIAFERARAEMI